MSTESNKPNKTHKIIWIVLLVVWSLSGISSVLSGDYFIFLLSIAMMLVNDYMYNLTKKRIPK